MSIRCLLVDVATLVRVAQRHLMVATSLNFSYPSSSRRMMQDLSPIDCMAVWANVSGGARSQTYSNHSFVDVAWRYADGMCRKMSYTTHIFATCHRVSSVIPMLSERFDGTAAAAAAAAAAAVGLDFAATCFGRHGTAISRPWWEFRQLHLVIPKTMLLNDPPILALHSP